MILNFCYCVFLDVFWEMFEVLIDKIIGVKKEIFRYGIGIVVL